MAQAVFVQDGESIDYTPVADVAAGDVIVQGDLVGVAKRDIPAGKLGALTVGGVFDFTKLAALVLAVGTLVYWDDAANVATNVSVGNKLIGKVVRAAAAADATVRVRLSP
jgi:predicted RecA/RadA family phage recombinase